MSIRNANEESVDGTTGKIPDLPNPPTSVSGTDVGTSRAYNNGAVSVAFTGDTSYWAPTSYTVTSSPGSFTATGASSPLIVTGLNSQTAYTFTAFATNSGGNSVSSSASASVTATTVPQAPVITATPTRVSNTSVTIPFTVNTGGKTISAITATSSPSIALTVTGTTSPVTVTGTFAIGQAYTFTLTATNANGTSSASSASTAMTPGFYSLGDTGPGGGKIYYDAGSTLSWGRYLETINRASSLDVAAPQWSSLTTTTAGASGTAIGTGKTNTDAMIAQSNASGYPGKDSRSYNGGGQTDWLLPSKDEMYQMYVNNSYVGGALKAAYYWSSSEFATSPNNRVWAVQGDNGGMTDVVKSNNFVYRPIRYN